VSQNKSRLEKVEKQEKGMRERGTIRKYDVKYTEKRDTKIGREPGKDKL
jgi:hypothetical protein